MQIIDYVIIGIVVICALLGLKNGVIKTVLGMIGWVVAGVASYFLTPILADAFMDVTAIRNIIIGSELSIYGFVSEAIPDIVFSSGIVETIFSPFMTIINNMDISPLTSTQVQALALSYAIFTGILFGFILLMIRIVVKIIGMVSRAGSEVENSAMTRFFGFLLGGVKGLMYVCIIALGTVYIMPLWSAPVDQINESMIGKPVVELVTKISDGIVSNDHENALEKLISYAKDGLTSEDVEEIVEVE